jgi:uncharacterized protein YcfL
MTPRILFVLPAAALLAAGCAGTPKYEREGYAYGCPTGMEKKIGSKEALVKAKLEESGDISYVEVTDVRCAETPQSMRVEVDLVNTGSEEHRVAYRFRWLDKEGMAAATEESWKPLMLYGKTRHTIATTSPSPDVADFRIMLRGIDKP